MITMYRLEDADGGGIYRGEYSGLVCMKFEDSRHPMPHQDAMLFRKICQACDAKIEHSFSDTLDYEYFVEKYVFGFISVEQLRNWFYSDEFLESINEYFVISEYEVDESDVIVGHTQAMFIRTPQTSFQSFRISEYFNLTSS